MEEETDVEHYFVGERRWIRRSAAERMKIPDAGCFVFIRSKGRRMDCAYFDILRNFYTKYFV